jgi:hypothetical protein
VRADLAGGGSARHGDNLRDRLVPDHRSVAAAVSGGLREGAYEPVLPGRSPYESSASYSSPSADSRAAGLFMLVVALAPLGDTVIVLRNGGTRAAAYGIRFATAVVVPFDAAAAARTGAGPHGAGARRHLAAARTRPGPGPGPAGSLAPGFESVHWKADAG